MRAPRLSRFCPCCLPSQICFPSDPNPNRFPTSNTNAYHPTATVHKEEPFHRLHTLTLLLPLGKYAAPASPQNPLLLFSRHTSTQLITIGSKKSKMVALSIDTFAISCNPMPTQPYLSRWGHLLIKTVFIGLPHIESSTDFHKPPQSLYPNNLLWNLLFLLPSYFFSLETYKFCEKLLKGYFLVSRKILSFVDAPIPPLHTYTLGPPTPTP